MALYAGMLALIWMLVFRPKDTVHAFLSQGVSLLHKDHPKQALLAFNQALEQAKSGRHKAWLLCYVAACELRLRDKDVAIKTLAEALRILPAVVSRIAKEKDLAELYGEVHP